MTLDEAKMRWAEMVLTDRLGVVDGTVIPGSVWFEFDSDHCFCTDGYEYCEHDNTQWIQASFRYTTKVGRSKIFVSSLQYDSPDSLLLDLLGEVMK